MSNVQIEPAVSAHNIFKQIWSITKLISRTNTEMMSNEQSSTGSLELEDENLSSQGSGTSTVNISQGYCYRVDWRVIRKISRLVGIKLYIDIVVI